MTGDPDQFDDVFLDYARRALEMAGIETDSALKIAKPVRHSLAHAISEVAAHYAAARAACPQSWAHWEQAEFFRPALCAAIWDLQFGAIQTYAQFEYLYSRLLGERAIPFLPSLFAAAALSPSLDRAWGRGLVDTIPDFFDPD